jgi:hypothetical protein
MQDWGRNSEKVAQVSRRGVLASGLALSSLAVLPGCATMGSAASDTNFTAVIRRLLDLSTQRAFASLTADGGFWNSAVARVDMPTLFGKSSGAFKGVLSSKPFRETLQRQLNTFAEDGARRAAPVVAEAVRNISIPDAYAVLRSEEPTAATTLLRSAMGPALVNAMIPELDEAMRAADNPIISQALSALSGVNVDDAAKALALEADNAIWYQIGAEESKIRQNPASTNDPLLIGALKLL